jgi:uncharacterized protein
MGKMDGEDGTEGSSMNEILVTHEPSPERLNDLGVGEWPIWEKEVSEFPWTYDERETCYILEGEVVVTPEGGEPVRIAEKDLVVFPAGMSCRWKVVRAIRKHYRFG